MFAKVWAAKLQQNGHPKRPYSKSTGCWEWHGSLKSTKIFVVYPWRVRVISNTQNGENGENLSTHCWISTKNLLPKILPFIQTFRMPSIQNPAPLHGLQAKHQKCNTFTEGDPTSTDRHGRSPKSFYCVPPGVGDEDGITWTLCLKRAPHPIKLIFLHLKNGRENIDFFETQHFFFQVQRVVLERKIKPEESQTLWVKNWFLLIYIGIWGMVNPFFIHRSSHSNLSQRQKNVPERAMLGDGISWVYSTTKNGMGIYTSYMRHPQKPFFFESKTTRFFVWHS